VAVGAQRAPTDERFASPQIYTPKHLAEKILTSKAALEGERKQVTVLFADLKGSMELLADRDPEEARKLLDPVLERMMEAVHRYDGTVNQVMGDGIMALFGAPLAQEDHAVRACYAALRMQSAVARYSEQLRQSAGIEVQIRVGLNSGEVVVRAIGSDLGMDYSAIGQTTHLASRMEQLAPPGTTRLTAETLALAEGWVQVRPLGRVPVKGLEQPVEVFELSGAGTARSRLQAAAGRGLTRFVGRQAEIATLAGAISRAAGGHGEIIAMVGEPGVGKSRLLWEFIHSHRVEGWLVVESASVSYGKASAYRPVIDLLKGYFRIEESDDGRSVREKVTGKLLNLDRQLEPLLSPLLSLLDAPLDDAAWDALEPTQRRAGIHEAVRRLLLREAQAQPMVVVFEDLHWIDHETQALLDQLVESLPRTRVLLLVNYRPEYQQRWNAKSYYSQIRVDPLAPESAEELLDALLGSDPSLAPVRKLLVERTARNALFLEESVRNLVETDVLRGAPGAYALVGALDAIEVPANVQAILASRIDRLPPEDKHLLQTAAVIGKDVPLLLLQAIAGLAEEELRRRLTDLQAAEFLYETALFPDVEYTFKHALTHEVAYGSVLHERRKTVHGQILEAMQRLYAERLNEKAELLGQHAMRAERWAQATAYLREAALKAFNRSAVREAKSAFEQALTALSHLAQSCEEMEKTVDLRLALRVCLVSLGDMAGAADNASRAAPLAAAVGDKAREALLEGYWAGGLNMSGQPAEGLAHAQRALEIAETLAEPALLMNALYFLGQSHFVRGDYCHGLAYVSREFGGHEEQIFASDLDHSGEGLLSSDAKAYSYVFLLGYRCQANLELGNFTQAEEYARRTVHVGERFGTLFLRLFSQQSPGRLHTRRGELQQAIALFEQSLKLAREAQFQAVIMSTAADLGCAYNLAQQPRETIALLEPVVEQAAQVRNMYWAYVPGLRNLADAYSLTRQHDRAQATAERAVEAARECAYRGLEAGALRTQGAVLARCVPAKTEAAEQAYRQALALATELEMRPLIADCHFGLGMLQKRTQHFDQSQQNLDTAANLYRDMGLPFWVERVDAERAGTERE
jgi:class 3 adenylate cyclase/tetratricopeptide (TPR) repeat protein